ncbi:MAG: DUF2461 domain-containing protein [Candidatus Dojkabacteria bacterium]
MNYDKLTKFLKALSNNNNKEWFEAHKEEYLGLRKEFENLVRDVILGIGEFDNKIKLIEPKTAMFRINRDVRFSKDKSPYKTHFSAAISNRPKREGMPGYYFEINKDGQLFIGGGMWMPEPDKLKNIRDHIVQQPEALEDVVYDKEFADYFGDLNGESLIRVPRGYDETNPLIKYIKMKSFTVGKEYKLSRTQENSADKILKVFKQMHPFIEWLREAAI